MSETHAEPVELEEQIASEMTPDADAPEPEPDDEPEQEQEPEQEPEPQEDTAQAMEEMGKKFDLLQKHVAKRMGEILGDQAQFYEECEVCSFFNTPGWRFKGSYPPEVEAAVRHVLGQHAPADYLPDNYSRMCDKCNGLGETVTGSKVQGQEALACIDCKARGWIPVGAERESAALFTPNGPQPQYVPPAPEVSAQLAPVEPDTPEVADLKARGYVVIPPFAPAG